jgi:cysteinyl-tRNA synthetase
VRGEKMSKSLGNFIIIRDLINKNISGDTLRLFLLSSHYRKPIDFHDKAIEDASKMLNYWNRAIEHSEISFNTIDKMPNDFLSALLDDMNTSIAIKIINDYAKLIFTSRDKDEKKLYAQNLLSCAHFIGLMENKTNKLSDVPFNEELVGQLIAMRYQAKIDKNWLLADQIRNKLLEEQRVIIEDRLDGSSIWRRDNNR